ncbi:MAG: phosphatidylinositol-3-phosphatase [Chloroflexota bacterium]|jgi:acid phosphatase|nr:phosphatidylinositol-3-phosphatase [Chloroflexota bacterium]
MRRLLALASILGATSVLLGGAPPPVLPAAAAPAFDHIFVIVEENMDESQVIGNPQAPFFNNVLVNGNFRQANYFGLAHGSLPDYLALVSGSEQRQVIGDPPSDCTPTWDQPSPGCAITAAWPSNIADSIETSGRTWRGYFQSMGSPCRWQSNNPVYDVTHNPFVYFKTVEGGGSVSSSRCQDHDVDLYGDNRYSLAADLRSQTTTPNFVFIAPDNSHNMHDGNVGQADRFLQDLFTGSNLSGANGTEPVNIFGAPAWTEGRSIAYVFFDEDSGSFYNQVAAVAVGNWVNGPAERDGGHFTHYSMLRTWEAAWQLPPLGPGDRAAAPMLGAFNLLDPGAASSGRLARGHPEVYARVSVKLGSTGSPTTLLSLASADGTRFRLLVDAQGRLVFENGARAPDGVTTSGLRAGEGWHTVELHLFVRGTTGTCEAWYDGRAVTALSQVRSCPTGSSLIDAYAIGENGAAGAAQFRDPALATSPL